MSFSSTPTAGNPSYQSVTHWWGGKDVIQYKIGEKNNTETCFIEIRYQSLLVRLKVAVLSIFKTISKDQQFNDYFSFTAKYEIKPIPSQESVSRIKKTAVDFLANRKFFRNYVTQLTQMIDQLRNEIVPQTPHDPVSPPIQKPVVILSAQEENEGVEEESQKEESGETPDANSSDHPQESASITPTLIQSSVESELPRSVDGEDDEGPAISTTQEDHQVSEQSEDIETEEGFDEESRVNTDSGKIMGAVVIESPKGEIADSTFGWKKLAALALLLSFGYGVKESLFNSEEIHCPSRNDLDHWLGQGCSRVGQNLFGKNLTNSSYLTQEINLVGYNYTDYILACNWNVKPGGIRALMNYEYEYQAVDGFESQRSSQPLYADDFNAEVLNWEDLSTYPQGFSSNVYLKIPELFLKSIQNPVKCGNNPVIQKIGDRNYKTGIKPEAPEEGYVAIRTHISDR